VKVEANYKGYPSAVFETGIYRHFKGGEYEAHMLAFDVSSGNSDPVPIVIYMDVRDPGPTVARRLSDFEAVVEWPDKVDRPRFCAPKNIGPSALEELHKLWLAQETRK
jgi:hypothetical protein